MKFLNERKYLKEYLLAILIFGLVTMKLFFVDQSFGMFEVALVHYGIGLLMYLALHYVLFVNNEIMLRWGKPVLIIIGCIAIATVGAIVLTYVLHRGVPYWSYIYRFLFLFFVILCVEIIIAFLAKRIDINYFVGGLVLVVTCSIAVCLPVTNGLGWDDQIHYERAVSVSNLFSASVNEAEHTMIATAYEYGKYFEMPYGEYVEDLNDSYENARIFKNYTIGWGTKQHFLPYVPAAMGMLLGRGLSLPYMFTVVLGRLMNAIFYSLMMFLAIKQLKSGKMILATFAFYPTNIYLAGTYSYDYWINSLFCFALCYFIGLMQDQNRKIKLKDMIIIFGVTLLGLIPKATYFPILLFYSLLNPKNKFENNKTKKLYYVLLIMSIIAAICWFVIPYLTSGAGGNDMRGGADVNSVEQIKYILSNPIEYSQTLLVFLKEYWSFGKIYDYASTWAYLGSVGYTVVTVTMVIIAMLFDRDEKDVALFGVPRKVIWGIIAFGISAINATALYVAFTPVGATGIAGCQTRYLLPIIFPTMYLLGSNIIAKPFKFLKKNIVYAVMMSIDIYIIMNALWAFSIIFRIKG